MATVRNNVAELYTPIYDMFMLEGYNEFQQKYKEMFKEIEDSTKQYIVNDISNLGIWQTATELSSGNYEDPVLGYSKTYTQEKFIQKFESSFESVDQDEYALLKKEGEAVEMGRGARARVETDTSAVILNGFATAGPDGQFLWDTDHPKNRIETGTTYSNLLSGAFSHDNLELAETQISNNYFSSAGIPIEPDEEAILLYAPANRGAVYRVLSERAGERPGTTLRDVNRFRGTYTPVEWTYLKNNTKATGSSTVWGIIYPKRGFMKIIWSQRPHFTNWIDEENDSYKFKGRMLYTCGADNWRAGFMGTGL